MADSTIGIKVADGSYYPVLEHGFTGRKKLVLTTARDDQPRVQIDLYRGDGSALTDARYIGSLIIENIPAASQGEPEIDLTIGVDGDGQLSAEASDSATGESQRFSTSLAATPAAEEMGEAEFEIDDLEESSERPSVAAASEERLDERRRKGPSLALLILLVAMGVVIVLAVAYLVYRGIQGPSVQPLPATAPAAAAAPASAPAPAPSTAASATTAPAKTPASTAAKAVSYLIKNGDTLWDLSSTYYRNPWLYPKIAKANGIRNPDLIFAGTRITIPAN